jgi:hypothetical protein
MWDMHCSPLALRIGTSFQQSYLLFIARTLRVQTAISPSPSMTWTSPTVRLFNKRHLSSDKQGSRQWTKLGIVM